MYEFAPGDVAVTNLGTVVGLVRNSDPNPTCPNFILKDKNTGDTYQPNGKFNPSGDVSSLDLVEPLAVRIYRILRHAEFPDLPAEDGQPLTLVDAVSDPAPGTIDSGETRLRELAVSLARGIILDWETARTLCPIEEDNT